MSPRPRNSREASAQFQGVLGVQSLLVRIAFRVSAGREVTRAARTAVHVLREGAQVTICSQARLLVSRVVLAAVTLIMTVPDRLLGTEPRAAIWVPEARVVECERWET